MQSGSACLATGKVKGIHSWDFWESIHDERNNKRDNPYMLFDRLDERNITVESIVHFDNFGYQQV